MFFFSVQTKSYKGTTPRPGPIYLARTHQLRTQALIDAADWNNLLTQWWTHMYNPHPLWLDTQIFRWPGKKHVEISTPLLWSHRVSTDTQEVLSFIFNFVAVYLAALNTWAKSSDFGHCREEMKGTNSVAILQSSFLFKLCMIHGLH